MVELKSTVREGKLVQKRAKKSNTGVNRFIFGPACSHIVHNHIDGLSKLNFTEKG